jgi:thioredoxin 1
MAQNVKSVDEFHNILEEAVKNDTYIIVDFYTTWCGPCKQLAPIYEQLAQDYTDDKTIKFLKVDVQDLDELADEYEISSIPTLKFFKGANVNEAKGFFNKDDLQALVTLHKEE